MKTTKHIAYMLLALLSAGCGKDSFDSAPPSDGAVEMTFTASAPCMGADTRTALGPEKDGSGLYPVLWSDGDAIAVMSDSYSSSGPFDKFTTSIDGGGTASEASFTGTTSLDADYVAFYPYANLFYYNSDKSSRGFGFTLPSVQKAVAGTFDNNLCPAWARMDEDSNMLRFKPACSLVKFRLTGEAVKDIESVRLDVEGEVLSGQVFFECANDFFYRGMDNSGESYVTLTGPFEADVDYYMVTGPFSLKEISFTFTRSDGAVYIKRGGGNESVYIGQMAYLGTINLPDLVFDEPVIEQALVDAIANASNPKIEFVKGDDGKVRLNEENKKLMATVEALQIDELGLNDGSVIKYFTGLMALSCYGNNFTELDVSGMPDLIYLNCGGNRLTKLDLSNNLNLESLNCSSNRLTELEINHLTNLTDVACGNNRLTRLDVGNLAGLKSIRCFGNRLGSLDVSAQTGLQTLECSNNELTELDLSHQTELVILNCGGNGLTELKVAHLANLWQLNCSNNMLKELDVRGLSKLSDLECGSNQLTELDVTGLDNVGILKCENNHLSVLDVSQLMKLQQYSVLCGKQTNVNDGSAQTLTLTLTAEQEGVIWNSSATGNENVSLNVLP